MEKIPVSLQPYTTGILFLLAEYEEVNPITKLLDGLTEHVSRVPMGEFVINADAAIRMLLAAGWCTCEGIEEWQTPRSSWRAMPAVLPHRMEYSESQCPRFPQPGPFEYFSPEDLNAGPCSPSLRITDEGLRVFRT